jgi:hypothetical protein
LYFSFFSASFYSLHLILCAKLMLISSSIHSSSFFLGSSRLMSLSNLLPIYVLLLNLTFYKHILAHFSNRKFIVMSLLIASQFLFHSPNRPHFHLAVSIQLYTLSDLFSSQFVVLDIQNQLRSARFLTE